MADCLFCKIIAGEVPADVVHETDTTLAFRDIDPQAPTHVLVIPRSHQPDIGALAAAEPDVAVDLLNAAAAVAKQEGLDEGYRLVFNTGAQALQTVFHAHVHVIGGRDLRWPPG
jgi:histidine triad (HIT) family protein